MIGGLQKLTLLDYPGKLAATVFLTGCNFRCPFCHNKGLVTEIDPLHTIDTSELFHFLQSRKGKLQGVCITGGEPTLDPQLPHLVAEIKSMGYAVKLDTNGTNPLVIESLIANNLIDAVAMDLKNSWNYYDTTAGCKVNIGHIQSSYETILKGKIPYEIRTTFVKELHPPEAISEMIQITQGISNYTIQSFRSSPTQIVPGFSSFSDEELLALQKAFAKSIQNVTLKK